jgi:putative endopeptidase
MYIKKHTIIPLALIILFVIAVADCSSNKDGIYGRVRPQDDLYEAVNSQWLATTQIPADRPMVSMFSELATKVEDLLMADFAKMSSQTAAQFDILPEFLKFYALASDYETRNAQGAQPLAPYLAEINALNSLRDLSAALPGFIMRGLPTPINASVAEDMGDARRYALYIESPSIILPDVSYYDMPEGAALLQAFGEIIGELLQQCGYSEQDAARIVDQAMAFDALIKTYEPSAEESSDYTSSYNPMPFANFVALSSALDLDGMVTALVPSRPANVVVENTKYMAAFNQVVSERNFPLIKSWMTANLVFSMAGLLSQDMQAIASEFGMILTGQEEMEDPQIIAYNQAYALFSEPVGLYYGRTYFGEEAKRDVTEMVNQFLQVYRRRLQANDWLSQNTIQAALRKLDNMTLYIGYPDKIQPVYYRLKVKPANEGGTFLSNFMELARVFNENNFSKLGQETDRSYWVTSAATVNAFYSPMKNSITFPAAILQSPQYVPGGSASSNLGGIGAVIAHEITHAFDSNGSKFDEYGSLYNWWTEADYMAFERRIQAMVDQFDGLPFAGGTVNGRLTVGENIADAGGLSCALEVCQSLPHPDYRAFFESWARLWRNKSTPQVAQMLLAMEVHAPSKLRANIAVRNFDLFYTAFSVKEGDGMYLAPEKRVSIW